MEPELQPRVYPPLPDPSSGIRLLRFEPECTENDIHCAFQVWDRSEAPDYTAISYTWGDPERQETITVNGEAWCVRYNCEEALGQAYEYDPKAWIWIDSLCIDQGNLVEKSAQVASMGDIYAHATEVLACIGPEDCASRLVARALPALESIFSYWFPHYYVGANMRDMPRREFIRFRETAHYDELCHLCDHLCLLANREYFSRLWIVQELYHGGERVTFLSGRSGLTRMAKEQLFRFVVLMEGACDMLNIVSDSKTREDNHARVFSLGSIWLLQKVLSQRHDFSSLFGNIHVLSCQDPRDRIYGLLGLVDWSLSNLPPIMPDYSISRIDLALQCIPRITDPPKEIWRLLPHTLGIGYEDVVRFSNTMDQHRASSMHILERNSFDMTAFAIINMDGEDRLQVDLTKKKGVCHHTDTVLEHSITAGNSELDLLQRSSSDSEGLKKVFTRSDLSALVCKSAKPGDVFLYNEDLGTVVARPRDGYLKYEVVGRAMLLNSYEYRSCHPQNCKCWKDWILPVVIYQMRRHFWSVELDDLEALLTFCAHQNGEPVTDLRPSSMNIPRAGTFIRCKMPTDGKTSLVQLQKTCAVHGEMALPKEVDPTTLYFSLISGQDDFNLSFLDSRSGDDEDSMPGKSEKSGNDKKDDEEQDDERVEDYCPTADNAMIATSKFTHSPFTASKRGSDNAEQVPRAKRRHKST